MKYFNFDFRGRRKKFAIAFVLLSVVSGSSDLALAADPGPSDETIAQSCEHFRKFFASAEKDPKSQEQLKAWTPWHERLEKICGMKIPFSVPPKKGVVEAGEGRIYDVGPEERSSGPAN